MFEFCNDVVIGFVFICRLTIQCHGLPVIDFVLMIYLVMMLSLFFYVVIHECVAPCYVVHLFAHMLPVTDSVVSIRCQLMDVTAYIVMRCCCEHQCCFFLSWIDIIVFFAVCA